MAKKFLTAIDLNNNELQNVVVQNLGTDHSSPADGQVWYRTDTDKFKVEVDSTTENMAIESWVTSEIDSAVAGGMNYEGGYDASADPSGTALVGDTYTVTTGGQGAGDAYWTDVLEIGDVIICESTNPADEDSWTVVSKDLQIIAATSDAAGIVELATITETNTGTDADRAVTPDGLDGWTGSAQVVTVGEIATGTWSGNTLIANKVPDHDNLNNVTANEHIDWTADDASVIDINNYPVALGYTAATNQGTVTNDAGANSVIPLADGTNAGLMTAAEKTVVGNTSNSNTGDQTSIVGITGTIAEFNTACTDQDFATGGGTATGSNTGDQTNMSGISDTTANFNSSLSDGSFATGGGTATGTNTGDQDDLTGISDTIANFNIACSDATFATGGGTATNSNTGDEPAASDTVVGVVELAIASEVDTGTSTTLAITPDALEGSALQATADGAIQLDADDVTGHGTWLQDDDNFTTPSAVKTASSESIKEYVDNATGSGLGKYKTTVGNGALTTIGVNHALNEFFPIVQVYTTASTYDQVECEVLPVDVDNLNLVFTIAPTTDQYTVVVVG